MLNKWTIGGIAVAVITAAAVTIPLTVASAHALPASTPAVSGITASGYGSAGTVTVTITGHHLGNAPTDGVSPASLTSNCTASTQVDLTMVRQPCG